MVERRRGTAPEIVEVNAKGKQKKNVIMLPIVECAIMHNLEVTSTHQRNSNSNRDARKLSPTAFSLIRYRLYASHSSPSLLIPTQAMNPYSSS
jgi:hypothetical protein